MLSCVQFGQYEKILDLGCGYGLIGIYAAKAIQQGDVWMTDRDPLALDYATRNSVLNHVEDIKVIKSDGFYDLRETNFTKILCNPPYHVDFSVPKHFIEKGFNRLVVGGSLWMVTKRKTWYSNKLRSIFGSVRVRVVDNYFVFEATKKSMSYANQTTRSPADLRRRS